MRPPYRHWNKNRPNAIAVKTGDRGLTLVECLVAITVVGVTGLLITPPLFISAATRVQNRRAEQALKVAQGEVDRVRLLIEKKRQSVTGVDGDGNLLQGQVLPPDVGDDIAAAAAPTDLHDELQSTNSSCDAFSGTALPGAQFALPVDIDGDCEADFLMQTFRDEGTANLAEPDKLNEFRMGVRVYAVSAAANLGELETTEASLRYTTGLGNQQRRPLAVLYSDFVWSDRDLSVCQYLDLGECT